jgi:hypothetical protein
MITARDICLAIRQDDELQRCFGAFEIGSSSAKINLHNIIATQELQLKE